MMETADQGKLIVMLYDGAIGYLEQAKGDLGGKGYSDLLFKAQDVITELMCSLNFEAGDIAKSLYNLYDYINRRITQANIEKDPQPIEEVIGYLRELRGAWAEITHVS